MKAFPSFLIFFHPYGSHLLTWQTYDACLIFAMISDPISRRMIIVSLIAIVLNPLCYNNV